MANIRNKIYMVEGITCSGKTTMIKDITSVMPYSTMLEHPPRLDDTDNWEEHQNRVFDAFFRAYAESEKDVYTDFSPFAVIPFTVACYDMGYINEETLRSMLMSFASQCDDLCKRHLIYLHRYLHIGLDLCLLRLERRARLGDDTWDEELLSVLIPRYDEFFVGGGLKMKKDRVVGVDLSIYKSEMGVKDNG